MDKIQITICSEDELYQYCEKGLVDSDIFSLKVYRAILKRMKVLYLEVDKSKWVEFRKETIEC